MHIARGTVTRHRSGLIEHLAVVTQTGETYLLAEPGLARPGETVFIDFVPGDQFCRLWQQHHASQEDTSQPPGTTSETSP